MISCRDGLLRPMRPDPVPEYTHQADPEVANSRFRNSATWAGARVNT